MFDYHIHSRISFDSKCPPEEIVAAAESAGLKEICFTDHYDFNDLYKEKQGLFTIEDYRAAYEGLRSDRVAIRRGVEFGLTPWNQQECRELLDSYDFDYVLGSVHYAGGYDPYAQAYWQCLGSEDGFEKYMKQVLECVKVHDQFDALGHLNYVCKSLYSPTRKPLYYADYRDLCDEIMTILVQNGKGMEINTSGVDRCGEFLPSIDFLKRFRELGGEIITVGSDAHTSDRVGQYTWDAVELAKEVFGYVCTFENRKPIFHKF